MTNQAAEGQAPLTIRQLGWSLSLFLVITYVLCVAFGVILPGWGLHQPWLQFFPGFEWLTFRGFFIGLVESFIYGWYVSLIFVPLFNYFTPRG